MSAGSTGYDIIVPTDATLVKMKHANLVEPLDLSLIPNVEEPRPALPHRRVRPGQPVLDPVAVGHDRHRLRQDEGRRRRSPTGTRSSCPAIKGKSSYLDEARDAFAMALFALKKDPEHRPTTPISTTRKNYLIDLKKTIKSITSDYQDPLKSGELLLAQAYSGDVFTIQADNKPNIEYVIPKSGAFSWVDSMAIPKGAPHPGNAEKFMNYILEPKVGAALTNFVNYGSPNKAAEPFINKDILEQSADLPVGRGAREAPVPEGHRRGRAQVLRPVDRGQDGLTPTDERRDRARSGGRFPTGSRATSCCSRRASGSSSCSSSRRCSSSRTAWVTAA